MLYEINLTHRHHCPRKRQEIKDLAFLLSSDGSRLTSYGWCQGTEEKSLACLFKFPGDQTNMLASYFMQYPRKKYCLIQVLKL